MVMALSLLPLMSMPPQAVALAAPLPAPIQTVSLHVVGTTLTAHAVHRAGIKIDYQFRLRPPGGQWTVLRRYTPSATFHWTPPAGATGTYHVQVAALTLYQVRHNAWSQAVLSSARPWVPPAPKISSVTLTLSGTTFTAHAVHPAGVPVDYQFRLQPPGGQWTVLRRYTPSATFQWTPPVDATGTYHVQVAALTLYQVRHNAWTQAVLSSARPWVPPAPKISSVTLTLSGTTFTAHAVHLAGVPVDYQFRLQPPGGQWTVLQRYTPSATFQWTPPAGATGTYHVQVAALTAYQVLHNAWDQAVLSPPANYTPPPPPTAGSLLSLAYGDFLPGADGSYSTITADRSSLSVIVPTWFYDTESPNSQSWSLNSPPAQFTDTVTTAHSEGIQVWPQIGSISVAPFQTEAAIETTVSQIVTMATTDNFDGITIDFEPTIDDGLTLAEVQQQYTNFMMALGPALHAAGKILMANVYPYAYPQSPYNFAAIAPYVNYLNIMSYGEFDSATEAGPTQALPWDESIYTAALADGVAPSQIIMGLGAYGDYWSFNNSGLDQGAPLGSDSYVTDAQVSQLFESNPQITPIWDPATDSTLFMTDYYLNADGVWTLNPSGQAVAPEAPLSIADEATPSPQVQNLQGLLNYILVRYAVDNNQAVPDFLSLAQDGQYGPITTEAVAQFQQDFNVSDATPGVYGPSTQTALSQVITQWNLGEYQYWVGNTKALANRVQSIALADHLAGVAIWREPFESSDFWSTLEQVASIIHLPA